MACILLAVFCPGCRAPYGARGLKSAAGLIRPGQLRSRPVWGAWIEIEKGGLLGDRRRSRAPYGARGLKSN